MRHLRKIGILCVLASGCSLIVGNKLDEKAGDARPQPSEAGKSDQLRDGGDRLTIQKENPAQPFFVIGERFGIAGAHPDWQNAKVQISNAEGTVFCPAGLDPQKVLRAAIPSHSPEGKLDLKVIDGTKVLGSTEIEVRRIVLVGAVGHGEISLFTNDPFEKTPYVAIDLGGKLQGGRALLAPSGRYLLASIGASSTDARLVLVDLVTRKVGKLEVKGFESPVSDAIPHSFEPVFGAVPQQGQLPLVLHYPEARVWIVSATGELLSYEIEPVFLKTPKGTPETDKVQQILWAVVPTDPPRSAAFVVSTEKLAGPPYYRHALIKNGTKYGVQQQSADLPLQVTYASPLEGQNLRSELVFVLLLHPSAAQRRIALIPESGVTMTTPTLLQYGVPAKDLLPETLTAIPGTGLAGLNFANYPPVSAVDTLYGRLVRASNALAFEVGQRPGAKVSSGQRTDTFPSILARDRLLIRSGELLSTFEETTATPAWNDKIAGLTWAAHHPRRETVYASAVGVLHQYNYGGPKPGHLQSPAINLPTVGVYIQP